MHKYILPFVFIFMGMMLGAFGQEPAYMVVSVQPVESIAGQPVAGFPTVTVFDATANPVGAGMEIKVAINASDFTALSQTAVLTDSNGMAIFDNLITEVAFDAYALTFRLTGITEVSSDVFQVEHAQPHLLSPVSQPRDTLENAFIPGPPIVQLEDEFGNPVPGIEITASLNQHTFSTPGPPSVVTNFQGRAIFDNLAIEEVASGYEIIYNADNTQAAGVGNVNSEPFTIFQEQYLISITNQPVLSVAAHQLETADVVRPLSLYITDIDGNPRPSGTLYANVKNGSFTPESTTSAAISNGIAVFDNLSIETPNTGYQLVFSNPSPNIADAVSEVFDVVAEVATMNMHTNTLESISGIPLYGPPAVYVENSGIPMEGIEVIAYLSQDNFSPESTLMVTTDNNGVAIFDNLVINTPQPNYTIHFKSGTTGIASISSASFDVVEEVAVIDITQQPLLTIAGQPLNGPPAVFLGEKTTSNPVLGQISVSLSHNNFSGSSTTLVTTVSGHAVFNDLIVDEPGDYELIFSVPNSSGIDTVHTSSYTVLPIAGNMTVTTQPLESIEGYALEGPPTMTILGIDDITPIQDIEVTAILNKNGFSSGTTTIITDTSGQAVFSDLVIDNADSEYTIVFDVSNATGIVPVTSTPFDVVPENFSLQIWSDPSLTITGEIINGLPAVKLFEKGNPEATVSNANIYVSLNKGSFEAGTLVRKTNSQGIAVFDDLVIDSADNDYELIFSTNSSGIADVKSGLFDVIPVAGTLTVITQPEITIEGYTLTGPPTIQILDEFSNGIENTSVTAILSKNNYSAGTQTRLTNSEGVIVFDDLIIEQVDQNYTIDFDVEVSDGVTGKTSDPFDVVTEMAIMEMHQQPLLSIQRETINGAPSVIIRDTSAEQNPIPGIEVFASLNGSDFAPESIVMAETNDEGIAVFNYLIINEPGENYQLVFSTQSSGVADITSAPFEILAQQGEMFIDMQPLQTVNGYPVSGPPTVRIMDLEEPAQPLQGLMVTAAINKNDFTVTSTVSAVTNEEGVAVFDNLIMSQTGDDYQIIFSVYVTEGIPSIDSDPFRVVTEVAIITIETQPELTIAGEKINGPPTVKLETKGGLPVSGSAITAVLNKSGFAAGSSTSVTTNAQGLAVFNNLAIDDADSDYTLTFISAATGVADKTSESFEMVAPQGLMVITQHPSHTVSGYPIGGPPTLQITENDGITPKAGIAITAQINQNNFSSGTLTLLTDANGYATFDDLTVITPGSDYMLTFSVDNAERITPKSSALFDVNMETGFLTIMQQPSETVAGDPINGPPVVRLTNLFGNGVPDVNISVTLNKNEFNVASTLTATTNSDGFAFFNNLIIDVDETDYTLSFEALGATGVAGVLSNPFMISDSSLEMVVSSEPLDTSAGQIIGGYPAVTITGDIEGEITGIEGVLVTASLNTSSFAPASTLTATTNVNGVAVFDNLTINQAENNYQIIFKADYSGVPNTTSHIFAIHSASPFYILASQQPESGIAGELLGGPPAATLFDVYGNTISNQNLTVVVNQNDFSTGTLVIETNAMGVAVFEDLVLTTAAPDYQLFFTAEGGVTTGNSEIFQISNAAPEQITILTQPSETVAGAAIEGPPQVKITDEYGNPAEGETIEISEAGGYIFDNGSTSLISPSNGTVSFSDLVISTTGLNYQLRFSVAGLETLSNPFKIIQGTQFARFHGESHSGFNVREEKESKLGQVPVRIEVVQQPLETVVGNEISGPPQIVVYDATNKPISELYVSVSTSVAVGGATSLPTDNNGAISFTDLTINEPGNYQLHFNCNDYPLITASSAFFEVIDALATMEIIVQPQQTIAGEPINGHPTVTLTNSIGMPIQGVAINAYINQYHFEPASQTQVITDENGLAVFEDLILHTAGNHYQIIFDTEYTGVQNLTSTSFAVIAAQAYSMNIATQPGETLEGATITGPPAVRVVDAYGNTVAGHNVIVSESVSGTFDAGITSIETNNSGIAAFTTLVINNQGIYQLEFDAPGISSILSSHFQVISGTVANRFTGASHSGFTMHNTQNEILGQTPHRMEVSLQPQETVAGYYVEGSPSVIVYDETNRPLGDVEINVDLSSGSFTSGTFSNFTESDGSLSFADLVISSPGNYTLLFELQQYPDIQAQSASFEVIEQSFFMSMLNQPTNSIAGQTIAGPPSVVVENIINEPLEGVEITAYINQNGFASGHTTVSTNTNGEAIFDDLVLNIAAENYQLIFEADYSGISNISSAFFNVTHASVSQISIQTQPSTTIEGATLVGPPSVMLRDAFDNLIPGVSVNISEVGGYTFDAGTTSINTNASGIAIFNDLIIDNKGSYQLRFNASGVENITSLPFNVTSGTVADRFRGSSHSGFTTHAAESNLLGQIPGRIAIVTQPGETVVGYPVTGPPQIIVYDIVDNPMQGIEVNVTNGGTGFGTESTSQLISQENGGIVFDNLVIEQTGTYQLTFAASEHPALSAISQEFNVVNQHLVLSMVTQPGETVAGEIIAGHPTVKLANAIGIGREGVDITVYLNQNNFNSPPASQTVTTGPGGIAVFDELIINTATSGYQLIFDAAFTGVVNHTSDSFTVVPAQAHHISVITEPENTESNAVIGGFPAVSVSDVFFNPIAGAVVEVSTLQGQSFMGGSSLVQNTNASGIAVFNNLRIEPIGQYNLSYSAADVTEEVLSASFSVVSGNLSNRYKGSSHSGFATHLLEDQSLTQVPARMAVINQPGETIAGEYVEGPARIVVYDENDKPVGNVSVSVTTSTGFTPESITTMLSEPNGEISWNSLVIESTGIYQLEFTVDYSSPEIGAVSAPFEVIDQQLFLSIIEQPLQTVAGQSIEGPPAVRLATRLGQSAPGVDITVLINQHHFSSAPHTQIVTTDINGYAVFDQLEIDIAAQGYQLIFDADANGVINITSELFAVVNGNPHSMAMNTQPTDTQESAAIEGPPSVIVYDEFGNALPGIEVTVAESGGYLFAGNPTLTQTTNTFGIAVFDDLVIDQTGQYSLSFGVTGIDQIVSHAFNVYSGTVSSRFKGSSHSGFIHDLAEELILGQTPTLLTIQSQPMETIVGNYIEGPPSVILVDETGNPVGDVFIEVYIAGGGGGFASGSNTTIATNKEGVAVFDSLLVNTTGNNYTLTFEAQGYDTTVPNAISQVFAVVDPQLVMQITQQPLQSVAGSHVNGPPTVRLTTAGALQQPFANIPVTVYVNQHNFALGQQTVLTNDEGYAVFDDLVIHTAALGYQIIFDADYSGVSNESSDLFDVVHGPAHHMLASTQPLDAQANATIEGPPAIGLYDAYSNPVSGVEITVTEEGGYPIDAGTFVQTTNASGQAIFNNLSISTAGYYALNFNANVLDVEDIQSQQFRVMSNQLAGRFKGNSHSGFHQKEEKDLGLNQIPTYIAILVQPQQTVSGTPVQGAPTIAVYDQLYRPFSNLVITASVVGGTTPAMAGNTTITTNAEGEAEFNYLIIDEQGEHRLNFIVGGHSLNVVSEYFEVIAPVLSMEIFAQPKDTQAGQIIEGLPESHPGVIVTDGLNQGVQGITVDVYLNQNNFSSDLAHATAQTNASGIAVFDGLTIDLATSGYQILFDAQTYGINQVTSDPFIVYPGPAENIVINTQPGTSIMGAAIEGPPAATLYDIFNNPISGETINVREAGNEDLGINTQVVTNADGASVFSNLVITNTGTYQLIFEHAEATPATSLTFNVNSSAITGRFHGNTHSGFTQKLIADQKLMEQLPVEAPVFFAYVSELCEGGSAQFSASALHSDSIEYSLNPQAFGIINEDTGWLELHAGFSGTLYVIARAYGHEGPQQDSVLVNVLPEIDVPEFDETEEMLCQGAQPSSTYLATTLGESQISYSFEPEDPGHEPTDVGSMDENTGTLTWNPSFYGRVSIIATATPVNGCGEVKTARITVTMAPEISIPVFAEESIPESINLVELCQDSPNTTYLATAEYSEGITYINSDSDAGTLNGTTGVMNWNASFSGEVTITAQANGCGGPKQTSLLVVVHPTPDPLTITGATTLVCETQNEEYSVSFPITGSIYLWEVPEDATWEYTYPEETHTITVNFADKNGYITATEISEFGCEGNEVSMLISLDGCNLMANFDVTASSICEGNSITFEDISTGDNIESWSWFFEGGSPAGSSLQGPHTVTYGAQGTYIASLIVKDGIASDTLSLTIEVDKQGRWLGTHNTIWQNPTNWSCSIVPTSSMNVVIEEGAVRFPSIPSDAVVHDLAIHNGAEITLANGSILNIYGNWSNDGVFNYNSSTVHFHGNDAKILGSSEKAFNNLNIGEGAKVALPSSELNLKGNLTVDGTITHNNGTVTFSGNQHQTISGSGTSFSDITFYNLQLSNTGEGLHLEHNISVAHQLSLNQGVIFSSESNIVRILAGATSDEGSNASHIDGPVQRAGSTAFTFPTGNNGIWAPIAIDAPGAVSEVFVAQYFFNNHPDNHPEIDNPCNNCEENITYVSSFERWYFKRVAGSSRPNVTMYFKDMARSGITHLEDLVYAIWDEDLGQWRSLTLGATMDPEKNGNSCFISASGADLGNYDSFHAPASKEGVNPLPIELLSFDAFVSEKNVIVEWITASEINNDYFTVEKSADGKKYEFVAYLSGAGTTSTSQNYTITDTEPYTGLSYYRLTQTDFDGKFEIFSPVAVNVNAELQSPLMKVFPNPASKSHFNIQFSNPAQERIKVQIFNELGENVYTHAEILNHKNIFISANEIQVDLRPGVYFVIASAGNFVLRNKLIIIN